jgi:hypothetical protein
MWYSIVDKKINIKHLDLIWIPGKNQIILLIAIPDVIGIVEVIILLAFSL